MRFALSLVVLVVTVSGCGGTAVVEEGAGGAGNAASSSSGSATSGSSSSQSATTAVSATTGVSTGQTTGTGVDCDSLTAQYLAALDAATACNACQGFDACIGGPTLIDQCGCPVPLKWSGDRSLREREGARGRVGVERLRTVRVRNSLPGRPRGILPGRYG